MMLFFQRRLALLLSIILVVLLSWQLVHWSKMLYKPKLAQVPTVVQIFNPATMASQIGTRQLFGESDEVMILPQAITSLNLKLSGVFAVDGTHPSVAIISVDNKDGMPFKTGDTVVPNVTLEQVLSDHVILSRAGVMEKLRLESKSPVLVIPVTVPDQIKSSRTSASPR